MASLVSDLRDAIADGEIRPHFQPQFDLRTGEIVGVEALARWTHRDRGDVAPSEFVPAAEASGQMRLLGHRILDAACAELRVWLELGHDIELSVNVSPTELSDPGFCADVLSVLDAHDLAVDRLTLELTETEPLPHGDAALQTLAQLHDAGLRISVDDFGVGMWIFEQVHDVHAQEVKLDRSLIQHGRRAELSDIVERAHAAGARVLAEGVETEAHLRAATDLGCDRAQGYFLAVPIAPANMAARLDGTSDTSP